MVLRNTFIIFAFFFSGLVQAQTTTVLRGDTLVPSRLSEALRDIPPGSIVIMGEQHGEKTHQGQHMEVLRSLRDLGHKVSVGLEFFYYPDQERVDLYRQGKLPEIDFLQQIGWGGISFDFYRDQAQFPNLTQGEHTIALNSPRKVTSAVSKGGLASLSDELKSLLPPGFQMGRDSYKKRFLKTMEGHLPSPEAGDRYFEAQCVWDDTMAWRAQEFIRSHPDQILLIVVGEFHVQYGGGLPYRLRSRGIENVFTFSQILTDGLTPEEIDSAVRPSDEEGPRAQWILLAPKT